MANKISIGMLSCLLLLPSVSAFSVSLQQQHQRSSFVLLHSAATTSAGMDEALVGVLKKPSKTLAVIMDMDFPQDASSSSSDVNSRSMQLRKLGASAIATRDLETAKQLVEEQESAMGNFPGPCPVIYTGTESVEDTGVAAITAVSGADVGDVSTICIVDTPADVAAVDGHNAFLVHADSDNLDETLRAIPTGSVIVASVKSMQDENAELEVAKELKDRGVTAILMERAIVNDGEDLEYAEFCISGLTKKKSSTFNMSGLTGSTNGHFGGVASTRPTTWLRTTRQ